MCNLEELSISDLKAVYEYAEQELNNYENIADYAKNIDKENEEIERWFNIKEATETLLESKIKQIFNQ